MKCIDCGEEASAKINLGEGEFYYLCREHYLLRKKNGDWVVKDEVAEVVSLEHQNGKSAINPRGFKLK